LVFSLRRYKKPSNEQSLYSVGLETFLCKTVSRLGSHTLMSTRVLLLGPDDLSRVWEHFARTPLLAASEQHRSQLYSCSLRLFVSRISHLVQCTSLVRFSRSLLVRVCVFDVATVLFIHCRTLTALPHPISLFTLPPLSIHISCYIIIPNRRFTVGEYRSCIGIWEMLTTRS